MPLDVDRPHRSVVLHLCVQACLTVWWIILRFMGDIAEPRAPDPSNPQPRRTSSAYHPSMVQRQGRRLSSMVGLDQVR